MIKKVRETLEGNKNVVYFSDDGNRVTHTIKTLVVDGGDVEEIEDVPQPTLEERVEQLQSDSTILLMALADIYTEIQTLKGGK